MPFFDCASTTLPYPEVLETFSYASMNIYGNSSSPHEVGRTASRALEKARSSILSLLKISSSHTLVFNSGASEGNNYALKSIAWHYKNRGKKILVSSVEHPSISSTALQLSKEFGFEVSFIPVNEEGVVEPKTLEAMMDPSVILVSVMGVNNETGSVNDLKALSDIVHRFPKAYFHSDLTQALGKVEIPYPSLDLITFSGHKIGGIKATGALIYKKSIAFLPLISGGDQEYGYRAGTVNVPGALSLEKAVSLTIAHQSENFKKMSLLRDYLREKLSNIEEIEFVSPLFSSPYILNFVLKKHKASVIVEGLSQAGYYVSSISACSTKSEPVSKVLLAMGYSKEDAGNSIRVSMPLDTKREEIDGFVDTLAKLLQETFRR